MKEFDDVRRRIVEQVRTTSEDLVELTMDLIRFPTESPPARNAEAAQCFLAELLQEMDAEVDRFEVYPGDPDVVGRFVPKSSRAGGRSLLLNGHIDVAHVGDAEGWEHPPFEPVRKEGRIFGRGTADMKGGIAAALHALRSLRRLGLRPASELIFESVVGEEMGEAGTLACVERGYRADLAVVLDTTGLELHGQGGVITGWITIESPQTFHDAMRRNMIHAGGGLFGASAIEKMMKIIAGLNELERHWAVTRSHPGFPPGVTTINPAYIEGGRHPAFVADRCALWVTVHFYPDRTAEEAAAEIEEHLLRVASADPWLREHPPKFRWGGRSMIEEQGEIFPPVPLDTEHPGIRRLASIHQEVTGREARFAMSQTVTDGGWLAAAGMPTIIYGPGELEQAHSINESVSESELVEAATAIALLIHDWCGVEPV